MLALRHKLTVAFAGLFLLLVLIAGLAIALMEDVSKTFDRIFHENLTSVEANGKMRAMAETLDDLMRDAETKHTDPDSVRIESLSLAFDSLLRFQAGNVTVFGEQAATDSLVKAWSKFREAMTSVLAGQTSATWSDHDGQGSRLIDPLRRYTESIIELNTGNILSTDGEVRHQTLKARRTLTLLLSTSAVLIVILLWALGRLILRPISLLTRSVKEIEKGNLDLSLQVRTRDELGELAEAFNAMAARLREFRRSDQARFLRTQKATQMAINSLPDAVAVLSVQGEIEMANEAASQHFGIKPGAHVATLGLAWLQQLFDKVMREMRPFHPQGYESALQIFLDGHERFFLPHAIPIVDDKRLATGLTVVLADVTELRRLDESKSDLIATVSHEFKTRLTSVRMAVHLLLDDKVGELNDRQAELLLAARDDSERLFRIIEGLLDLGRIRAGKMQMDMRPVAAAEWIRQSLDAYQHIAQDKGLRLAEKFPEVTVSVLADPARIDLVLENLLSNAVKYTPPGGEITVSYEVAEQEVAFSVSDTGVGIPEEELHRIFERFYRGARLDAPDGAGLGLAIAKEIVEAHGGHMSVTSRLGQGSVFTFTLKRPLAGEA
jgi:two-component system, NtrC family, sensor histidine kinase KinB